MDFPKEINLAGVLIYLHDSVKEKSIRYIDLIVDRTKMEDNMPLSTYTEEDEKTYKRIKELFGDKPEKKCQEIFNRQTEDDRKSFNVVSEQKLKEQALTNIGKKLDELKRELEIKTQLAKEVDNQINK
jgi:hypothetical protein